MLTTIIFLSGQPVIHAGITQKLFLALQILHWPLTNSNNIWLSWPDLQVQSVITKQIYNIIRWSYFSFLTQHLLLLSALPNYVNNFNLIVKIPVDRNILSVVNADVLWNLYVTDNNHMNKMPFSINIKRSVLLMGQHTSTYHYSFLSLRAPKLSLKRQVKNKSADTGGLWIALEN